MREPRLDQFTGCLIGQCLGDALGFMVEGQPADVCRRYVNETMQTGQVTNSSRAGFPFGQYSDDSQLARELLRSYVEQGGFDPEDYARRIAALFAQGLVVGRGRSTELAAQRLAQGIPWQEAGAPPPAAGNGSAMRAAPVGLIAFDDPQLLAQTAHDQGFITHQDRRCAAGAVAIAGAVALALLSEPIDRVAFSTQLADWTRPFDTVMSDAVLRLTDWLNLEPEVVAPEIRRVGLPPDYDDAWPGISPFVTSSVLWSLYAFLRHPDDYWTAVSTAISVGGDVDTTAAMTGAISGAYLGLSKLPPNLARRVNDRGSWRFNDLVALAGDGYELKMKQ